LALTSHAVLSIIAAVRSALCRRVKGFLQKDLAFMSEKGFVYLHRRGQYGQLVADISGLLEQARRAAARSVNAVLTSAYWQIGRRIVEHEQHGKARAGYGEGLLVSLAKDLTDRYGRGFSKSNLFQMRAFFLGWEIFQTPSGNFEARASCLALPDADTGGKLQTPSGKSETVQTVSVQWADRLTPVAFPLSWSHYVRLMSVQKPHARAFYESEAILSARRQLESSGTP
jgi:hypothetical protein